MENLDRERIRTVYERAFVGARNLVKEDDPQYLALKVIIEKLCQRGEQTILDAGCGSGKYAKALVELDCGPVYGIDLLSPAAVNANFNYVQSSIDKIPFANDSFDIIYSYSVIFYLDNPVTGLREFCRVLKPGGTLLISAHTRYSLFTLIRVLKRAAGLRSMQHLEGVRFYSAGQYVEMLNKAGFEVAKVDGFCLSLWWYPFYRKLARLVKITSGINLPLYRFQFSKNRLVARLRSIFAYHSIIVANKK